MYSSGQGTNASQVAPREPSLTDSLQGTLSGLKDRVLVLRDRLGELKVRALGSEPPSPTAGKEAARQVPNGTLHAIEMVTAEICQIIEDCHALSARLERIA